MRGATLLAVLVSCAALAGCTAPADLDGEVSAQGGPSGMQASTTPATAPLPVQQPTPVVVDSDLGADDLVALAFLLRHPGFDVRAVTIAATGLVGCGPGIEVLGGLVTALDRPPLPVACGSRTPGPGARIFPAAWRAAAAQGSGITPDAGALTASTETAPGLIARLAQAHDGLVVLALGPLTTVAEVATQHPQDYRRLAAVHAMAGSVGGPVVDGVAEWNAAADPEALDTVLAAPAPLTLVPEDAVPPGTPNVLQTPVVARIIAAARLPAWWDLAAAAVLASPHAGSVEAARWALDRSVPGRVVPLGHGSVRVVRSLDRTILEAEYARAFSTG